MRWLVIFGAVSFAGCLGCPAINHPALLTVEVRDGMSAPVSDFSLTAMAGSELIEVTCPGDMRCGSGSATIEVPCGYCTNAPPVRLDVTSSGRTASMNTTPTYQPVYAANGCASRPTGSVTVTVR